MNILVTGGAGFIGSNFILDQISNKNNNVLNYDKLTYAGNLHNLKSIENHKNYIFMNGDINDSEKINNIIKDFSPDSIINFAAESHVDRSIDGPGEFIKTNINGTYELLSASLNYYNRIEGKSRDNFRFLHVSTDEVYGSLGDTGKFTEKTPYDPSSPYSASKAASDHLVRAWGHTYKLPILITNCSNNYGSFQFPEKLIPLIISNCINHKPLPIYGKGDNIRDWIYVEDHCIGIYTVLKKGKVGESYNIGGNQEFSNIYIVRKICNILDEIYPSDKIDSYDSLITFVEDRPGHDFRYAIDSSKIEKELGFSPTENLESGLAKTISWYLNNLEWVDNINNGTYNQERLGLVKK